jgi:hypothetical protein
MSSQTVQPMQTKPNHVRESVDLLKNSTTHPSLRAAEDQLGLSRIKSEVSLTVHSLFMHLINAFILVDCIEELLVRLLNHPDLVTIVDEVA